MSPCDYSRYPPDWKQRRERILARAGNRCEQCGVENHSWRNEAYIVLTIAHLDHDESNWEVADDRLRAWCQRCHNRYDREHRNGTARMTRLTGGEEQPELPL